MKFLEGAGGIMEQFEIVKDGLVEMVTDPDNAFKKISTSNMNLLIPVVVLIIMGILLGAVVMKQLPGKIDQMKESGRELTHNVDPQIKSEKAKAFVYPFFTVGFWFLFNIAFSMMISKMNGLGEMSGIFKSTSMLVYPYFIAIFLKYLFSFIPALNFIYMIVLLVLGLWTVFILWKISVVVGQLAPMDGALAASVPAFFFMMLWLSYDLMVNLFVYRFAN